MVHSGDGLVGVGDLFDQGVVFTDLESANRELARLRELAIRDPLTGLYNRRFMEDELARQTRHATSGRRPLVVAMIDLDDFRGYNDRHGHPAGDQALRQTATLIQGFRAATDVACRYGGEEFLLIMPDTTAAAASVRLDALRAALAVAAVHHEGRPLDPVTASIGVAEAPPDGGPVAGLLDAADRALYRAKRRGRNRVETVAFGSPS